MSGSSHAISVSIDTNRYRLVDQHGFQRASSGVPHGEFSHHSIPEYHGMAPVGHIKIGKWIRKTRMTFLYTQEHLPI